MGLGGRHGRSYGEGSGESAVGIGRGRDGEMGDIVRALHLEACRVNDSLPPTPSLREGE